MKRTQEGVGYRTHVVPVRLPNAAYRQAHNAAHAAGLMWNSLVAYQRAYWDEHHADPSTKQLRHHLAAEPEDRQLLHSHSRQAIVDDLTDAITTYRKNKTTGTRTRAPWREKKYRPLAFTRNYGWKVTPAGKLGMSFGKGRPRLFLPLPVVTDSVTGESVPATLWGEIRLCWNRDDRTWELHIAYRGAGVPRLNPDNILAIDEGIINPMTVATQTPTGIHVTVINGRHARAVKHRRNTAVAALRKKMSRCVKGSRQWKRYNKALKRANAAAQHSLRNIDHQVSRKVTTIAQSFDTGTIVAGDVRGIEQSTKVAEKRRFGRHQRRRLSQWSRGRQERYLEEKSGVTLTHIDESYSSKTCPACLTRNRPSGRKYQCQQCQFTCHRDAVGAINILMRATHGTYRGIDPGTPVQVTYLRATPLRVSARSTAQNRATSNPRVADPHTLALVPTPHTRTGDQKVVTVPRGVSRQKPRP